VAKKKSQKVQNPSKLGCLIGKTRRIIETVAEQMKPFPKSGKEHVGTYNKDN